MTTFDEVVSRSFGLSTSCYASELSIIAGDGSHVWDDTGKMYLDLHAGPAVMSTGHSHPVILQTIIDQSHQLIHCHDLASPARLELLERLEALVPGPKRKIAILSGGSETVELALRVARGYTGRDYIAVFSGAFHGKTLGALDCTDPMFKDGWWCKPRYTYRLNYGDSEKAIKQLELFPELPAAILIEPAQGTAGNIFPPHLFLEKMFAYCEDKGIITIADEILTGCGRTGKFLMSNNFYCEPDIILMGKGLASGYPIGAALVKDYIADRVNHIGNCSTSFGGNPLACAIAAATLRVIEDEGLVENSREVGELFLSGLHYLAEEFSYISNVRGQGLMLGFDLNITGIGNKFFKSCLDCGVMIMGLGDKVRINPPLTMNHKQVEEAINKLYCALDAL